MDNENNKNTKNSQQDSSFSEGGIRELLDRLALRSLIEKEEAAAPPKTYEDFKFWKTQPVPKFGMPILVC